MKEFLTYTGRAIYWILYLGLAGVSFLFVQETLRVFLSKKTDFHIESASPMTARDIPTFTFCWDVPSDTGHQTVFTMHIVGENYIWIDLAEGENQITDKSGVKHYLRLQSLNVLQYTEGLFSRKCLKVSPMEKELASELLDTVAGDRYEDLRKAEAKVLGID